MVKRRSCLLLVLVVTSLAACTEKPVDGLERREASVEVVPSKVASVEATNLDGVWYAIDYQGKLDKTSFLEISGSANGAATMRVHGDSILPGSLSVRGSLRAAGSFGATFEVNLVGEYPDGKSVEMPLEVFIVRESSYPAMTGAISLTDPNTPDGVELGRFQRAKHVP